MNCDSQAFIKFSVTTGDEIEINKVKMKVCMSILDPIPLKYQEKILGVGSPCFGDILYPAFWCEESKMYNGCEKQIKSISFENQYYICGHRYSGITLFCDKCKLKFKIRQELTPFIKRNLSDKLSEEELKEFFDNLIKKIVKIAK